MSSSALSSSSNDGVDGDDGKLYEDFFGPLAAISAESLILLTSRIASKVLGAYVSPDGELVSSVAGPYNIVYTVQLQHVKMVVRVPATGWGSRWTTTAADALNSQATTLRLLWEKTAIPVPEVYDLDTTSDNHIGAPYLCTSFIPGKTVSKVWFDDSGALPREEMRLNILKTLATVMAQFSALETFDKIGSVVMKEDAGNESTTIGPLYNWNEELDANDDDDLRVEAFGPFGSTFACIQGQGSACPLVVRREEKIDHKWKRAATKIVDVVMSHLPGLHDHGGFVLCPPSLDSQNVMVDERGNVTGLVDWDLVQTAPNCLGYARYPGWITRDWDPLMYGWPEMADSEDPPQALERYRAFYNEELGRALGWKGDWVFTERSHVFEAVWCAASGCLGRTQICCKLVEAALGQEEDALGAMDDIGSGTYSYQCWAKLVEGLQRLLVS